MDQGLEKWMHQHQEEEEEDQKQQQNTSFNEKHTRTVLLLSELKSCSIIIQNNKIQTQSYMDIRCFSFCKLFQQVSPYIQCRDLVLPFKKIS